MKMQKLQTINEQIETMRTMTTREKLDFMTDEQRKHNRSLQTKHFNICRELPVELLSDDNLSKQIYKWIEKGVDNDEIVARIEVLYMEDINKEEEDRRRTLELEEEAEFKRSKSKTKTFSNKVWNTFYNEDM